MNCTITCDCGRSIRVDTTDRYAECPGCRAGYAVTITRVRHPSAD